MNRIFNLLAQVQIIVFTYPAKTLTSDFFSFYEDNCNDANDLKTLMTSNVVTGPRIV